MKKMNQKELDKVLHYRNFFLVGGVFSLTLSFLSILIVFLFSILDLLTVENKKFFDLIVVGLVFFSFIFFTFFCFIDFFAEK